MQDKSRVRLVPVRIPGTCRFKIKVIEFGPDGVTPVEKKKGKKTKMEKRRIRRRYEKERTK